MGIVADLTLIVIAALVGGFVAHTLRQPLILGYILAGILIGPHTAGPTVEGLHDIEMLAEVGIALLLFTLGLEFSFGELKRLSRVTFIATPLQIALVGSITYFFAIWLGLAFSDAVWVGSAVSLSSTMVVLKTLAARDSADSHAGRLMLAILIAQDLAVIPLILIVPQIAGEALNFGLLVSAIGKSALFLMALFIIGTKILPWAFSRISRFGSRELFFLATLAVALGSGFVFYKLGFSFALGAFVAGMLLSETDFNHQALSDVSSLRDLFGLIFFASVGMLFDPQFFLDHFAEIGLLTGLTIISKAIMIGGILHLFGSPRSLCTMVGLGLSQVGELAFVLASTGSRLNQLSADSYSMIIAVTVLSMILTPGLFSLGARFSRRDLEAAHWMRPGAQKIRLENHVVIIGGGVVGQYLAQILSALERPYVVIEIDYKSVTQMHDKGINVIFGDGSHRSILETAALERAKLAVITTTNDKLLTALLSEIRQLNQDIRVVVRVAELDDINQVASLDVYEIVQPQMEVGLEMIRQALLALGHRETEIFTMLAQLRASRYRSVENMHELIVANARRLRASQLLEFIWVEVAADSELVGRSLRELAFREKYGISIAAIIHNDDFVSNPDPNLCLSKGDLLGALGTESHLREFARTVKRES